MFKGLGDLAGLGNIMKQAQEMGGKMQELSAQLKKERVVGSAGAGLVEVEANGLGEALAVRIDPALLEKQDQELLEDLLPAAFNAAQQKAKQLHAEQMQALTGGLNLPGLSDALGQLGGSPTE
ncbi:MAG: YbaB/EbfC family nucleoid-associated protein [Planctomycetales bacterium]|nr:YbaB/EbfC family nucleoid-associated protein [Planctomycetales bacterium]